MDRQSESDYSIVSLGTFVIGLVLTLVFMTSALMINNTQEQPLFILYIGAIIFLLQSMTIFYILRAKNAIIMAVRDYK